MSEATQLITSTEPVDWTFTITVLMDGEDLDVTSVLAEADGKAEKIQQDNGYTSCALRDRSVKQELSYTHITSTYRFIRKCQK